MTSIRLIMYVGDVILEIPIRVVDGIVTEEKVILLNYILERLKFSIIKVSAGMYTFCQRDLKILEMLNIVFNPLFAVESGKKILNVNNQKLSSSAETDTFFIK